MSRWPANFRQFLHDQQWSYIRRNCGWDGLYGAGLYGGGTVSQGLSGQPLDAPIVGIAASAGQNFTFPYWLVASDGGVFAFQSTFPFQGARFYGSMGGQHLNSPIVGMAPTPDGKGYWLVAADGGVFGFGDANFYGSMGGQHLNSPIVGMAPTPDGKGYWLVAADGGVFGFGDANFHGSMGGQHLNSPIVGMARTPDGKGYYLAGADGGIFAFGDAVFAASARGLVNAPVIGVSALYSQSGVFQNFGCCRQQPSQRPPDYWCIWTSNERKLPSRYPISMGMAAQWLSELVERAEGPVSLTSSNKELVQSGEGLIPGVQGTA